MTNNERIRKRIPKKTEKQQIIRSKSKLCSDYRWEEKTGNREKAREISGQSGRPAEHLFRYFLMFLDARIGHGQCVCLCMLCVVCVCVCLAITWYHICFPYQCGKILSVYRGHLTNWFDDQPLQQNKRTNNQHWNWNWNQKEKLNKQFRPDGQIYTSIHSNIHTSTYTHKHTCTYNYILDFTSQNWPERYITGSS